MNPEIKLYPLIADLWKMDGGVAFGVVPKSMWNRTQMADENNMIPIVTRCLLVQTPGRLVLIDTGMGNKRDAKYYQVRYREDFPTIERSLNQAGFSVDDITDILFTHLHDDHVGAAVMKDEQGKLSELFPNAHYHVSSAQWDWAINPNKREGASYFKDNLLPLKESGKLHFIDQEGEWLPGICIRIFNGHTMGQIIPLVNYLDKTIVFAGDFIPTAYNIPLPFVPSVDIQPLLTMDEKSAFLEEAAQKAYILLFEHDYFNECSSVQKTEKGFMMDKSFTFSSIV
ncbi:MAG: MBL fold metallo-hydrolase [Bacteroidetes bacterium]|nr:MBL fold metallo-hydrolase [Bacteroidota bacterium]